MYGRKEASGSNKGKKHPINPSFFNGERAPKLHKLGLSPNIVHFESWPLGCRLRRGCALIPVATGRGRWPARATRTGFPDNTPLLIEFCIGSWDICATALKCKVICTVP